MTGSTKQENRDLVALNIPDNASGLVTPLKHREVDLEQINSMASLAAGEPLQTSESEFLHTANHNFTGGLQTSGKDVVLIDSTVIVKQSNIATTLGAAIDSAKVYVLDGIIDFTGSGLNIVVPAGGVNIVGYTFDVSKITCADASYTLFTSAGGGSGDVLGIDYAVEITGVGSEVYDITDATGNSAFEFARVNYNNCSSLGTISGYRQGLETGTGRFGGTPELTLAGTWAGGYFIETSLIRGMTNAAFSLYKAGAAFVMNSRFRSNQNIDLPALASILDFSAANFPNPSTLQLEGCLVSRNGVIDGNDANLTPNILASELPSAWTGNRGLANTFEGGELDITTEITTTIAVAGTFVDLAGTYTPADLQHFDNPVNGQLRHLGSSPIEYKVSGQYVLESTANDEVDLKVVIFRAATTTFEDAKTIRRVISNLQGGRNVAYYNLNSNVILSQNDYVKLQVTNITAADDVTAELDSFYTVEAR